MPPLHINSCTSNLLLDACRLALFLQGQQLLISGALDAAASSGTAARERRLLSDGSEVASAADRGSAGRVDAAAGLSRMSAIDSGGSSAGGGVGFLHTLSSAASAAVAQVVATAAAAGSGQSASSAVAGFSRARQRAPSSSLRVVELDEDGEEQ